MLFWYDIFKYREILKSIGLYWKQNSIDRSKLWSQAKDSINRFSIYLVNLIYLLSLIDQPHKLYIILMSDNRIKF